MNFHGARGLRVRSHIDLHCTKLATVSRRRLASLESLAQPTGLKVRTPRDGVCSFHQGRVASLRCSEVVVGFCDFVKLSLIMEVLQQEGVELQVGHSDLTSLDLSLGRLVCRVHILHDRRESLRDLSPCEVYRVIINTEPRENAYCRELKP